MKKNIILSLILIIANIINAQCWSDISISTNHSIAIDNNGRLLTWGYNGYGQLGDGTAIERSFPTFIGTDVDWTSISGGGNHTIALKANGSLWTWGRNGSGELGIGSNINKNIATRVGTSNDWAKIYGGGFNTFAQKTDGSLWATGLNYYGQLGDYTTTNRNTFVRVGTATDWLFVAPGPNKTLALKNDSTLWSIATTHTQIGIDTWIAIASGSNHSVGIKSNGSLWIIFNNTPTQIGTSNDWIKVSAGHEHTLALKQDGTLWSWGDNGYGQLGIGSATNQLSPVQVGTATNWAKIVTHENHNKALKSDGTLWAWGENTYHQLGIPYLSGGNSPVKVNCVTSPNFTCTPSISISASHSPTICSGTTLTFTAYPVNGGNAPIYQWMQNGTSTGITTNTYSTNGINNNDVISCLLTSNATCANSITVTSNTIAVSVNSSVLPTITISTTQTTICNSSAIFTSTITNAGTSPIYQWQKNGVSVGTNSSSQSLTNILNGDVITCVLTSNLNCVGSASVQSNSVIMTTTICTGIENTTKENINVSVYPNPVREIMNLSVNGLEKYTIVLYDKIGQIIVEINDVTSIKTSNYTNGIYYISVSDKNFKSIQKIVILN